MTTKCLYIDLHPYGERMCGSCFYLHKPLSSGGWTILQGVEEYGMGGLSASRYISDIAIDPEE